MNNDSIYGEGLLGAPRSMWTRSSTAQNPPTCRSSSQRASSSAQQAPLTPEYQKILEASLADQAAGGGGFGPDYLCISSGMPMRMTAYTPLEIIITEDTTHIAGPDGYMNRKISPMAATGRRISIQPNRNSIGNGSTRMATENSIRSSSRPEISGANAPSISRHPAARGKPDHRQGANLPRQDELQCPA